MCNFYLLTPTSPILLTGCDNIKFAPYNSTYPGIEEDALTAGISDMINFWDKPIVVTQNQSLIGLHWSLMNPSDFQVISVPIELDAKLQPSSNELINKANVILLIKDNFK